MIDLLQKKHTRHMNNRYRLTISLLLATLLSGGNATAVVKVGGSVYGGGNMADVQTDAKVNIKAGEITGDVFGGGKGQVTVVKGDVTVNIGVAPDAEGDYQGTGLIKGSVYGGSALGAVNATKDNDWDEDHLDRIKLTTGKSTAVNIFKGTVNGSVYGGGLGQKTGIDQATSDIAAVVFGNTTVTVGASDASATPSIDMSVYGGSNVNGVSRNDVTVNIIRGTIGKSTIQNEVTTITGGNVHGGGFGQYTLVNGSVQVNIGARTGTEPSYTYTGFAIIYGDVYGGSAKGNVNAYIDTEDNNLLKHTANSQTNVNLYGISLVGDIYGGGLGDDTQGSEIAANVYGPVTVTVKGGSTQNVFGGNNLYGAPQSSVTVNIDRTDTPTLPALYSITNVYGGGNLANNTTSPAVNVQGMSYVQNVFGGGNQAYIESSAVTINTHSTNSYIENVFGGGNEADVTGNTVVSMTGGRVLTALYGGCNEQGTVQGNASVSVSGGTIGAGTIDGSAIAYTSKAKIHGGGFGPATYVKGNVAVNISATPVIWGDVYGGSAQGHVNAYNDNGIQFSTDKTTQVNLMGGTISGDAYGGGLGTAQYPAYVGGDVTVQLNGTAFNITYDSYQDAGETVNVPMTGRLFGCNNVNGTPKGHVTVNVLTTVQGNTASTALEDLDNANATHTYHVAAVYGGGNEAPYEPTSGTGFAEVNIDGCGLTSIEQVYGGGNAASVPASQLTINGTYEIAEAFGGGNGKYKLRHGNTWDTNHGAHVGFREYPDDADKATRNSNQYTYGTGLADVNIYGGRIHSIYGGSNTKGNVREATVTMLEEKNQGGTPICDLIIDEVYGGGRSAEMDGRAEITIGCIPGVNTIYGGSRAANVYNDVVLNITNGTFKKIYGGNNLSGQIFGTITVNIEEVGCRPIVIDELYGGGNQAPYSVEDIVKTRDDLDFSDPTAVNYYKNYPKVNVLSATSIGKVFGGGDNAAVTGNPHVLIDMAAGILNSNDDDNNDPSTLDNNQTQPLGKVAQVFGGGNNAGVTGDTYVDIANGQILKIVSVPASQDVDEVALLPGVYGGSNTAGTITGNTHVTLTGATIGATGDGNQAEVYGGGLGENTVVTGTTNVRIGTAAGNGTTTMYGDLYGGSAFGSVANTVVDIWAHTSFTGNVYGGSKGRLASNEETAISPVVSGTATVNMRASAFTGQIYGGCNDNGTTTTAIVNLLGGSIGTSGTEADKVFGGGKGHSTATTTATVNVGSDISTGATSIYSNVYGGSALGAVTTANVNLNKATVLAGDVFGGGMGSGSTDDTKATVVTPTVTMPTGAAANLSVTGTGNAAFGGNIYGGCNINGEVSGKATIDLLGGSVPADVFGGGKGSNTSFASTGSVEVNMGKYENSTLSGNATIAHDVYGGSALGSVSNTVLNLWTGTIEGDVYGGGLGDEQHAAAVNGDTRVNLNGNDTYSTGVGTCVVKGNIFGANNTNGSPTGTTHVHIYQTAGYTDHNRTAQANLTSATPADHSYELAGVYGGGDLAAFTGSTTQVVIETCLPSIEAVYGGGNAADATNTSVLVKGAYEIGTVFGGGNGTSGYIEDDVKKLYANVTGTATTVLNGGRIHDFFGGSNLHGDIGSIVNEVPTGGTDITINDLYISDGIGCGLILDNIYGAGKMADVIGGVSMNMGCLSSTNEITSLFGGARNANINGDVVLTVTSGNFTNVFGGNDAGGSIRGSITVNIEETGCEPLMITNVYGGGNLAPYSGSPTVNLKSFTSVGNVFGGGYGSSAVVTGNPVVNINQVYGAHTTSALGTIGNVYGGGEAASVAGSTTVNIGTQSTVTLASVEDDPATPDKDERAPSVIGVNITGNVFGGGLGESTNVSNNVEVVIGNAANSYSPAIGGDVYGGSALGIVNGDAANDTYHTYVTLNKGAITGSVYGGGLGDNTHAALVNAPVTVTVNGGSADAVFGANNLNGAPQRAVNVNIAGGTITNVYGGGNAAAYAGNPTVNMTGGTVGSIYGGGLGSTAAVTGTTNVTIASAGIVTGNVYGGGSLAQVNGSTQVSVTGGTVNNNVYGGGSEADVTQNVTVNISGGRVINDVYGGGALANTNTDNWNPDTYVAVPGTYSTDNEGKIFRKTVTGYYINNGGYTLTADTKAQQGVTYYHKGDWKSGYNTDNATTYKTVLNLTGGMVGNAYGGGLGRLESGTYGQQGYVAPVEAMVYGDVAITVGSSANPANTTAFTKTFETDNASVPKTGRVFGANNLNGSPKGNINVTVWSTRPYDENQTGHEEKKYEIQAVYGGGNLANYVPAVGNKNTYVNIYGCDETSIEAVYGGGNSALVPSSNVTVNGTYELEYVFGGGNGSEQIRSGQSWIASPGADVEGNANLNLLGGTMHNAFGGSNTKGDCWHINMAKNAGAEGTGSCSYLKITDWYGGGKSATLESDITIDVSGCSMDDEIENIYAGSFDANIYGNVTLNITSGLFKNVYGGNNTGGLINGLIEINIEEVDNCKPIKIGDLYGGGKNAAYPYSGTFDSMGGKYTAIANPQITVNIKSCTSIGNVYGGGFGTGAVVKGNTIVNINMTKGIWAGKTFNSESIPNTIGTIGNVYGGGNMGAVEGNSTLNIGNETKVYYVNEPIHLRANLSTPMTPVATGEHQGLYEVDAVGAIITGNVYGGGNLADITGNTYVNIGAKKGAGDSFSSVSLTQLTIGGNVFGGGKGQADSFRCEKAMVGVDGDGTLNPDGGTSVIIGNGTIGGNVYGGGEVGRVEKNTLVTIGLGTGAPVVHGNVYAAGKGVATHGYSALVRGNATVTVQANAKVLKSVYGGGEIASVGRYNVADSAYHTAHPEVEVGMPYSLANSGTGYCTVIVRGNAEIGPDGMQMTRNGGPDDTGHVFGAGKGILPYEGYTSSETPWRMIPSNEKEYYGTGTEDAYLLFIESLALATQTDVTIGGNAFIKGSVYGGSENGHVQHDTHVTIQDNCQIGQGEGNNSRYTSEQWTNENPADFAECAHWDYDETSGATYDKYATYEYNGKYYYDEQHTEYANGGSYIAKDGHSYYGNVFGGGSGLIPYAPGKWHYASGSVGGNSTVDIIGGHILTSVYGGNEMTNVGTYRDDDKNRPLIPVSGGKCTVNMVGGTLGVPRTPEASKLHPVTCYLFGAGKGDQRLPFNTWTNVINTEVNITGTARIFGSTFGGGEDGHVISNAITNIGGSVTIGNTTYTYTNVVIGTTGNSYVDGNVFGGGRGFSGEAQTAGSVGGNTTVNIMNGTMLGSIYGGGRLASVGTQFTSPDDPDYGNFKEDETGENARTYGHVTVNISGGTIGNDANDYKDDAVDTKHGGNVFGGSMGRLTLLDGTLNPIWPKLAQVKSSTVNIYGNAVIKRNVYGGGEFGTVRDKAYVTIGGKKNSDPDANGQVTVTDLGSPTIHRDVYGGGYGSEDRRHTVFTVKEPKPDVQNPSTAEDYVDHTYAFMPMQFAGCVGQGTYINIVGGYIRKSVYGGGELASVGIVDCTVEEVTTKPGDDKVVVAYENGKWTVYKNIIRHYDDTKSFTLSWPLEFTILPLYPGNTYVNITGGRIGDKETASSNTTAGKYNTDNGDVYGGGKGIAGDYQDYVACANVGDAHVYIDFSGDNNKTLSPTGYTTSGDCIAGAVYGGGENGHVMGDTKVKLVDGLIGHALYGGGSGKGKFSQRLLKIGATKGSQNENDYYTKDIYSITAGKVFGNTEVEMRGGYVVRNVFGGGTYGSVGKGNYAGGADDYSESGYGETTSGNLWDNVSDNSKAFLSSGICTVKIYGGTVGYIAPTNPTLKDGLPYGNVFGGCRGEAAPNIVESPRYLYCPEFYLGYVNETRVIIGLPTADQGANYVPPVINGSVYGGGQDGHVRRDASVIINNGTIGRLYNGDGTDLDNPEWLYTGNVFGAGSGITKYKYNFNYDDDFDDQVTYNGRATKEQDYSTSAGSVTRFTKVVINDGTIYRNVYGGGSLASVGAPNLGQGYDEYRKGDTETGHGVGKQSLNEVIINGGQIGGTHSYDQDDNHIYGGYVYGASRGQEGLPANYATSLWTSVTINGGDIKADAFGGGEVGAVKCGVDINMLDGMVEHSIYGGGALANTNTSNWDNANDDWKAGMITTSGKLVTKYNTRMNILGGTIGGEAYGGALGRLANSSQTAVAAMVYGDITLNLNGLEKADYDINPTLFESRLDKVDNNTYRVKDPFDEDVTLRGATVHKIYGANNLNGTPKGHVKVHVFATQHKDESRKNIAVKYPKHPVQNDKQHIDETLGDYLGRLSAIYTNETAPAGLVTAISAAISANGTYSATESEADKTALDNAIAAMNTELGKLYDMEAVYGGGNLAEYVWGNGATIDKDATNLVEAARTEVIIEGCDYTSIKQVYGGGNAASTSGTYVVVRSTYEIDEVFGGGNGADNYYLIEGDNTMWYENPGANVGYHNYTYVDLNSGEGSQANPYKSVDNDDAMSADMRKAKYAYGSGIATTEIRGGTAHNVYGGSNKKGNISTTALSVYEEADDECPIEINETYGGGKDAAMDGEIELSLDCVKDMDMIFGGAKNADVYNNVTLNITNGHYGKVFGGNNTGGALYGTITVNIEEKGCVPIIIDELYGGGYLAPYSKYGYEKDANGNYIYYQVDEENSYKKDNNGNYIIGNIDNGKLVPLEARSQESQYEHDPETSKDLRINIISATRIGTVYGGGYKAKVVADPYVNINMQNGKQQIYEKVIGEETKYVDVDYKVNHKTDYVPDPELTETYDDEGETKYRYFIPLDEGNIGTVFGGGFLADVAGDTHIEIGTGTWVTDWNNDGTPIYSTYSEGVRNDAEITGDVYGGGDNADVTGNTNITVGNTNITSAQQNLMIERNIYGGGNMGSVGTITSQTKHESLTDGFGMSWPYEFTYAANTGKTTININGGRIGLSGKDWFGLYETDSNGDFIKEQLKDANGDPVLDEHNDPVMVKIPKREDNGDVYGGSKGILETGELEDIDVFRYKEALKANVRTTEVNINLPTPQASDIEILTSQDWDTEKSKYKDKYSLNIADGKFGIAGSVYGGGEDGHVYENTAVTINGGYVGHSVYGGGKGKGTISGKLKYNTGTEYETDIYSWTSGKVYGNTNVTMNDGYVMRNIYGGGNLGSVGKGNYAGGTDDYSYYNNGAISGYGETLNGALWDSVSVNSRAFLSSGKASVTINGGTVGFILANDTKVIHLDKTVGTANENYTTYSDKVCSKDDLPTGNVFGGARGQTAPDVGNLSPRYKYAPDFFLGYVNQTQVVIGNASNATGPRIYGSVYGGGQDGHVRRDSRVEINKGEIGLAYNDANRVLVGTLAKDATDADKAIHSDSIHMHWLNRGNVYGSGSGIGKYDFDINGDGENEKGYGTSSGSVTRFTTVIVNNTMDGTVGTPAANGNIIYRNVYGGGSLASVGPPRIPPARPDDPLERNDQEASTRGKQTLSQVSIAGVIGLKDGYNLGYGGNVYGASRGDATVDSKSYATDIFTKVTIKNGADIAGNVFGGGEVGLVKNDARVAVQGGIFNSADRTQMARIGNDLFGGGDQTDVLGNTYVNITGGHIMHNVYGGGNMGSVGTIDETLTDRHDAEPASDGALYEFALSWPVKLVYKSGTGDTHVTMTGGRIGTSGDENGDLFGGGKGSLGIDWGNIDIEGNNPDKDAVIAALNEYRYEEQSIANVNNTYVEVNFSSSLDKAEAMTIWDTDDQKEKPKIIIDATYSVPQKTVTVTENDVEVQKQVNDYEHGSFTGFGDTKCITGSVYGGAENGHVIGSTDLRLVNGVVGHSLYGGGKGKGTYRGRLLDLTHEGDLKPYAEDLYSLTAGKVYGNTNVIMSNGYVVRSVFGGGNLGSVGKGNYAGGTDDYSLIGYGELPGANEPLWEGASGTMAYEFMNSGKTRVEIRNGQIGFILSSGSTKDIEKLSRKDDLPTGNVFGACRGQASPNGYISPRYLYIPDFFLGYVNETEVIIGNSAGGPTILGSVYGGGQDGHVRRSTSVTINQAEIGIPFVAADNGIDYQARLGKTDMTDLQWSGRGNVFGAGSGIGSYVVKDATTGDAIKSLVPDKDGNYPDSIDYNYSSGSVTCNTYVEINELVKDKTIIHQNVYGGGSLASIGPPNTGQGFAELNTTTEDYPDIKVDGVSKRSYLSHKSTSTNHIVINGGTIGDKASYAANYGGNVFGASRGNLEGKTKLNLGENASRYASTIWTNVEAKNGHIFGNVFGGGESGSVTKDSKVVIGGASSGSPVQIRNTRPQATQAEPQTQPASVQSPTRNAATEAPQNRSVTTRQAAAQ